MLRMLSFFCIVIPVKVGIQSQIYKFLNYIPVYTGMTHFLWNFRFG